eukprot:GILJ01012490.1.p2 GENE.GILJ01012490.1~~GILJ01012490.1.p2  ORF type:complete len:110 (+),score=18.71 GILJ01012490.1:284-613(+)
MFGRDFITPTDAVLDVHMRALEEDTSNTKPWKQRLVENLRTAQQHASEVLAKTQEKSARRENKKRQRVNMKTGDLVWVFIPHREDGHARDSPPSRHEEDRKTLELSHSR